MIYSLTWLPAVLESAGLKVAPVPGWESRGCGDIGPIAGVICHHTAGPRTGNMPSLKTLIDGRSDLAGPLAQLGLGRDGTYYIIAAGRCNHAGQGSWRGVTRGNSSFIGIEAENTAKSDDSPWPDVQVDAYQRGVAAILSHVRTTADFCAGHKEFALPLGRKTDPEFDMDHFRSCVAALMAGTAPVRPLIPPVEPTPQPGSQARPTLRRGSFGPLVQEIQRKCACEVVDGSFGPKTEAKVRAFQRDRGFVADGIVGPKTWAALDTV